MDDTIVLNSAEFEGDVLKANFTIENMSPEDVAVSSTMSFEAKDTEGTQLDQEIFDCGSSLDGSVLPGDKLKGDVRRSGAAADVIKIYYRADRSGSGAGSVGSEEIGAPSAGSIDKVPYRHCIAGFRYKRNRSRVEEEQPEFTRFAVPQVSRFAQPRSRVNRGTRNHNTVRSREDAERKGCDDVLQVLRQTGSR